MMNVRCAMGMMILAASWIGLQSASAADPWLVFQGQQGLGKGKHIVLVQGDDEYRSEELMAQLGKILAVHQGFKCTVLFATDPQTGEIDPSTMDNIPGLEQLKTADLMIVFMRFRDLPDEQMKPIIDYVNSGKPIVALRTSTHSFNLVKHKAGPYAKWTYNNPGEFKGGFGRQVLGETWINHYGAHQKESTRGLIAPGMENHPIVRGVEDLWGPSDVYALTTLNGDCKPLIMGQVLTGMNPTDPPNDQKKLTPVAWTKTYTGTEGKTARVFTTTMGHVDDLKNEAFRRLLVNASYWALGMEEQIPAKAKVDLVGTYETSPIHGGKHKKGMKAADYGLPAGQ
jgi:type 1 glutamine amidotransferase